MCNTLEFSTLYTKLKPQGNGGNSGVTLKIKYKINNEKEEVEMDDIIKEVE